MPVGALGARCLIVASLEHHALMTMLSDAACATLSCIMMREPPH